MNEIIAKSRELAQAQYEKNRAPAWGLTELAVKKGEFLAKKHGVNANLVVIALYLAHTVFSEERAGDIQTNHCRLSAEFAKGFLSEWGVDEHNQKVILNAIEAHHDQVPTESKEAEVMKNAECFKFLTLEGVSLFLADLRRRGMTHDEAAEYALDKMNQKRQLLTLEDCKQEAEKHRELIMKVLANY
jgi:hypothetical protein